METPLPPEPRQVFSNEEREVLFTAEGNRVLPITLRIETEQHAAGVRALYLGLVKVQKQGWKQAYICPIKRDYQDIAPIGAIIHFTFGISSRKRVPLTHTRYYLVAESPERVEEVEGGRIVTKNLIPLETLTRDQVAEIEAEIINTYAQLSKYVDRSVICHLYYYWVKKRVAPAIPQQEPGLDLEEQVKKLEELIKQKEQELQALREQLQQLQLKLQLEKMKRVMVE
ncbi:MAG: hypothetical protein QXZ31_03585 [Thermofilaceae archaeon]